MCYVLWYISCYITCYVQAGLLDPPQSVSQWCYIAGYIPQYIARAILSHSIGVLVMLYSMFIFHAIQQIRLYSFPHIQHLAIQHTLYAIIPWYIAGKAIYLPSYMAFCYIAHILCYIAHAYTMLYNRLGYIASLIYSILLYSTYIMLYSTCIQQVL